MNDDFIKKNIIVAINNIIIISLKIFDDFNKC